MQNETTLHNPDALRPGNDGRFLGRIFALIWVINLTPINLILVDQTTTSLDQWTILGWLGLAAFVAIYVSLIVFGRPHFIDSGPRNVRRSQVAIVALALIVLAFNIAWTDESLELYLIYPAVLCGIYLPRSIAVTWLITITASFVVVMLVHGSNVNDFVQGLLLIAGIGANSIFWSELILQNRQLKLARAEITRLAVADERLRIARDLHDLLGHSLSLIALKSELARRLLPTYLDRATSEIGDIERVARTSLQEVREAVSGYRRQTLEDELFATRQMLQAAGINLSLRSGIDDLSPEMEAIVGWLIRESVTNIIRHANANNVSVTLSDVQGSIVVEVEDDGEGSSQVVGTTDGHGLAGLRERTDEMSGTLTYGDLPGGGFRVRASIPRNPPELAPEPDLVEAVAR
jgi:two-component system sensor histidine kinase DesK